MRIIGGHWKGKRFVPPDKIPARPTTDFAKEGLFNILSTTWDLSQVRVLDLFAGTGNISYEFGSRGCPNITAIEQDKRLVTFIRQQTETLKLPIEVLQMDVFRFLERPTREFDIIFAGPPYPLPNLKDLPQLVSASTAMAPGAWFILEHNPAHHFEQHEFFLQLRKYGTTLFSIFERPEF